MTSVLNRIAEYTLKALNYLELQRVDADERRPIAEVFVPPKVSDASGKLFDASQVLDEERLVVILGAPGAGKTTLLKIHAMRLARALLDNVPSSRCPLFFRASEIAARINTSSFAGHISQIVAERLHVQECSEIEAALSSGRVAVLIDGVDEVVDATQRFNLMAQLDTFSSQDSALKVVVSSRPLGLTVPLRTFAYFHLEPLDLRAIVDFSDRLSRQQPGRAAIFVQAIQSHRSLYALASNPLLLNLLWQVFQARGELPENQTSLYNDCTDFLLSTWERFKGGHRVNISLSEKQHALEEIAYDVLVKRGETDATRSELETRLLSTLQFRGTCTKEAALLLEELLTTGILVERSPDRICFIHLTFLEYYSARAVSSDPPKIVRMVERPELHNIVVMACGLLSDVAPIIEAAVEKRQILLAAKCISHGRTRNKRLADYVISSLIHEVGEPFIQQLMASVDRVLNQPEPVSAQEDLLSLFERASDGGLSPVEKGRLFEEFRAGSLASVSP